MQTNLKATAYILNRRPFRDNSFLVDVLTAEYGKFRCVARVAKQRGKILKGTLEPFVFAQAHWLEKNELHQLRAWDELERHPLNPSNLLHGLYMNELLLRLLWDQQAIDDLFQRYQRSLTHLAHEPFAVMQFELDLLHYLGHNLHYPNGIAAIDPQQPYYYRLDAGFVDRHSPNSATVVISGKLLSALHQETALDKPDLSALRRLLDQFFRYLLQGKPLHTRKLLPMMGS
ncbi:MAG TPA: DNA repair protein RecO [Thiothrix sp.]|nr:DNA repair protein RecO [Thiothrix sp.]